MSIGYLNEIRYPKQTEEILKNNRREKDMKVLLVGNTGYVTEELKKVLSPVSIIYKSSAVVEK